MRFNFARLVIKAFKSHAARMLEGVDLPGTPRRQEAQTFASNPKTV